MFEKLLVVAITAPSGGGKGAVVSRLMQHNSKDFLLSMSDTNRPIGEGEYYNPVEAEQFEENILKGHYFEHEIINGYFYGTPYEQLRLAVAQNKILLLDIDVNGANRFKRMLANHSNLFVFIDSGDDREVYRERIIARKRASDTPDKIKKRVERVGHELQLGRFECDLRIHNTGTLDNLYEQIDKILMPRILKMRSTQ